jgi:hypothetical protein
MAALASVLQTKASIESLVQETTPQASADGLGFDYKERPAVPLGLSPLIAPAVPVAKEQSGNSIRDTLGYKNRIK